jgi:hypothetical protein
MVLKEYSWAVRVRVVISKLPIIEIIVKRVKKGDPVKVGRSWLALLKLFQRESNRAEDIFLRSEVYRIPLLLPS